MEEDEKEIPLKCSIDKNGDVTCNITKEEFAELQKKNISPRKVVWDIK